MINFILFLSYAFIKTKETVSLMGSLALSLCPHLQRAYVHGSVLRWKVDWVLWGVHLKKKRLELLCHKIHHFKVYNSVGFFGVFRSLCHHDHYLILILFITPRRSSTPFGCHILIPCQTLAHFCLWSFLCLFWTVHLNGILQYVAFHVWLLLSLSIMFPLFIPVY